MSDREYISEEPPCGWEKLEALFIEKAAYLCTHIDWDDERVNFEALSQIIDYGKTALRECKQRKQSNETEINELKKVTAGFTKTIIEQENLISALRGFANALFEYQDSVIATAVKREAKLFGLIDEEGKPTNLLTGNQPQETQ